jgi:dTDP-4-dehydrorhamnose reductase
MAERKRILIIGGSGFIGTHLAKDLSPHHDVVCTRRFSSTRVPGVEYVPFQQLIEKDACKNLMQVTSPDFVIYAIGSNDIEAGERDPRTTNYLHTMGATHLQTASENFKARFIYLSSDTVFSGHGGNYAEGDITIPGTALGKAKLAAENHIRGRSLNYLIIRSTPLLGRGTLDHPSWLDRLRESGLLKKKFSVSERLIRNPMHVSFLSKLILNAIELDLRNETLHLGGRTKISERALAEKIVAGLKLTPDNLETRELMGSGDPHDYSLNFSQSSELGRVPILDLEANLKILF